MDYLDTLKKAFKITLKNKFLWVFGILIGGAGGLNSFNFNRFTPNYQYESSAKPASELTNIQLMERIAEVWNQYGLLILTITLILLLLAVFFFVMNIISQGALISSVANLEEGKKTNFYHEISVGWHKFWRVWGVMVVYFMITMVTLIVLVVPVIIGIITKFYAVAIFWGVLMFFVCLVIWLIVSLISPYSVRVAVLDRLGIWASVKKSFELFKKNWTEIIVTYLVLVAVAFIYGLAISVFVLLIGAILFLIGYALWLASTTAGIIYATFASLAFFICLVILSGVYNTFTSSILTLTYLRLKK
jgi:hypothetical protein